MGAEVFISYSSLDRDIVMPVVQSLRENGISVWVDEGNIHAADLWSEQIVQAIADCRVMVVLLSKNSADSHNVVKEVMLASEQKKVLLPVYLEPADIPAKLQYQLAGIQHLELYDQNNQNVLADLVNGLSKRGITLGGEVSSPEITTVKRHERPSAKQAETKSYLKKISAKSIALILSVLFILLCVYLNNVNSNRNIQSPESILGIMQLKLPIPDEYPLAKPSDMPFGVPSRMISISPTGKFFAYVCIKDDERYLSLIDIQNNSHQILTKSKGGLFPFFSPDEKWIGFVTANKLNKIEISSGLLKEICDATNAYYGATWGNDGMIYYGESEGRKFLKVSENGGSPQLTTNKIYDMQEVEYVSAVSGPKLIFRSPGPNITRGPFSIYSLDIISGKINKIVNGLTPLVYENNFTKIDDGQFRTINFDKDTFELTSDTSTLFNSRIRYSDIGSQISMSKNNVIACISGDSTLKKKLMIVNPVDKNIQTLFQREEVFGQYSISPDGKKVAVEVVDNQIYNIHILDLKRSRLSSVTTSKHNYSPFWSPDGASVYYTSNRDDFSNFGLYKYELSKNVEQKIDLIGEHFRNLCVSDVSNDGTKLLCFGFKGSEISSELYSVNLVDGEQVKITNNKLDEWGAVFSEDEKWIAYTSEKDMQGSYAIYINSFPEMDQEIRISAGGGEEPKWLPDGSGVYYRNGDQWMKVRLNFDNEIEIGEPELFFEGEYVNVWGPSHDVFPDGRVLLLKGSEWIQPTEIDIIINALKADNY